VVRTKLTRKMVREMFKLRARGWSQRLLGEKFGVNRTAVSRALSGKRWSEVRAQIKNPPPILPQAAAVRAANAKLSARQVRGVHRMRAKGLTQRAIASIVGVTRPAVGYILRGETFHDIWLEFNGAGRTRAKRRSQ